MEQKTHSTPWYRQPVWLGLLGLALLVGGYKLSTYLPEQKGQVAQTLDELDRMRNGEHADLGERLQRLRPEPPFMWPGRLVFLAGVGLCVSAGVMMARRPAPRAEDQVIAQTAGERE